MKFCILTATIDKKGGGPSRSVPILAKGLAEIGCDVTLVTVESDDMNTHILEGTSVKFIALSKKCTKNELKSVLLNNQFDLVHGQGVWVPIYHKMANILYRNNIPFIMTPRGALEPWCLKRKALKKKLALMLYQKRDLQRSKAILTTASMEANNLRNLGITVPIAIIPNGIDVSEYPCRPSESKESVKKQIVFISRISPKKGIEFLIDAWEQLHKKYPDWSIKIAGNGSENYIQELKNKVLGKGLQGMVDIIPPIFGKDKYNLYTKSSLFVLPTYSENFGMVIAEAMSCGLPIITTTGTPWTELDEKGIGWCIDLSLDNVVKTISKAIDLGQDKLFEMGQKGSQYVHDTFQYTKVAEKNKCLYEWAVGKTDVPEFVVK